MDNNVCYGCGACEIVCPVQSITIEYKSGGFLEQNRGASCCSCGLCDKVCPVIIYVPINKIRKYYAAYSASYVDRCSSGGVFGCIAQSVLGNGGVVYGASFDNDFCVVHKRIDNITGISDLYGSKYVKSDLSKDKIFQSVLSDLNDNKVTLFVGTGCQISALHNFLSVKNCRKGDLLTTVEIVCHGAPSPTAWEKYKEYLCLKYQSQITSVNFRDKKYGWHSYSVCIEFENGKVYRQIMNTDPYMQSYLYGFNVLEACSTCRYKDEDRIGDITIGDLWGIHIDELKKYYGKGLSLLTINSEKGDILFENIKSNMIIKELNLVQSKIAISNICGRISPIPKEDKILFSHMLSDKGFASAFLFVKRKMKKQYFKNRLKAHIKKMMFYLRRA